MTLPPDFQFSQGSLQDYSDCPRRFQLRYLLQLQWPAIEAQPPLENERRLQQGAAFHRLVHQHMLGIPAEDLTRSISDPDLQRWWDSYENASLALSPARYPEIVLSAPLGKHRLMARYDLITVEPGEEAGILDWKTSRKLPKRKWLKARLQSKVYPYLLVRAGAHLNQGQPFEPKQVEMTYWFPEFPDDPIRFSYDATQHAAAEDELTALVEEIAKLGDEDLPLTPDERRCRYCPYRSLCERGIEAGPLDEADDEFELEAEFDVAVDFDQIAEIEY